MLNRKEPKFSRDTTMDICYKDMYEKFLLSDDKTAHCLVELSKRQYQRMYDNMIILSDINNNNVVQYDGVQYGKNVNTSRKTRSMLINEVSDVIDLSKVKQNYIVVVAKSCDCLKKIQQLTDIKDGIIVSTLS